MAMHIKQVRVWHDGENTPHNALDEISKRPSVTGTKACDRKIERQVSDSVREICYGPYEVSSDVWTVIPWESDRFVKNIHGIVKRDTATY